MQLSERKRTGWREYLLRGGFLIVDDFRGENELNNFINQMRLVFPDRSLEELPRNAPDLDLFLRHFESESRTSLFAKRSDRSTLE